MNEYNKQTKKTKKKKLEIGSDKKKVHYYNWQEKHPNLLKKWGNHKIL